MTWDYHNQQIIKLKKIYQNTSKQTQNRLQEIFDSIDISFDNLYNIADSKAKRRINTYIDEWQEKGLLTGQFGLLAKNIKNRTRVKNSEILQLLIYSAYIEEQNKLDEIELNTFKDVANYYYQEGQEEVNKTLHKNRQKQASVIPDAIFLALLDMPNSKGYVWNEYIEVILKYNADQIYRQAIIDLQQQKELDITNDIYQNIINKQQNTKLNIRDGEVKSGDIDLTLIGINNMAKIEGIKRIDNKAKCMFISDQCDHVTMMCSNMDRMIFNIDDWNEFDRWYGETSKDLKLERIKVKGLVLGINLPPIRHHFHWCHSTITYKVNISEEEINKTIKLNYEDITQKLSKKINNYALEEQQYFVDKNNNRYKVDGKHVVFNPTAKERKVAELLGRIYGGNIKLLPKVFKPEGIKTPDYLVNGIRFDLKELKGESKNTFYNVLKGKEKQAHNFVIDLDKTKFDASDINEQVKSIYESRHRSWVETLIIIRNDEVIKIYKRK